MLLSLLGLYLLMTIICALLLAYASGNQATMQDIGIAALIWPYTAIKFIQHIIN